MTHDQYIQGDFDSNNPANQTELPSLTELEELQEWCRELRAKNTENNVNAIKMKIEIKKCLDILESPEYDNRNILVINKLKRLL